MFELRAVPGGDGGEGGGGDDGRLGERVPDQFERIVDPGGDAARQASESFADDGAAYDSL